MLKNLKDQIFLNFDNFIEIGRYFVCSTIKIVGQAARLISTSELKTLLSLHTWPINHVIYMESLEGMNP